MTTRSAVSRLGGLLAAGAQQPAGHLLRVAPVHLAAERPQVEPRQRPGFGQVFGQACVVGGGRSARRCRSLGRRDLEHREGAGQGRIGRSWLCRRAYTDTGSGDAGSDLGRDPQRGVRLGVACPCRRDSRCRRSGRGRASARPRRPPRPSPCRTSGSRPRVRRARRRPARGRCRSAPAPRRNGRGPASPPAARIASIAPTGPRPLRGT